MTLTAGDVRDALRGKLAHEEFSVESFEIVEVDTLHFHSDNHLVQIRAQVRGEPRQFSFFLKSVDVNTVVYRRYLGVSGIFEKELVIVRQLIPEIQKATPKKITAECYLAKKSFMVFEDLTSLGYRPSGRLFDLKHAKIAIEALANLHGASIFIQESEGVDLGRKYRDNLYESLFYSGVDPEESLMYASDRRVRAIGREFFKHIDSVTQDRVFTRIRRVLTVMTRASKEFYNVITQGDPWGGNILFKYENNEPVDALLVDFQATRFTPPAQELTTFLYVATPNAQFTERHSAELRRVYYESLARCLREKNLDVDGIISSEAFRQSCEAYEEFGVCVRVLYVVNTRFPMEKLLMARDSPSKFCDLQVGGDEAMTLEAYETSSSYRRDMKEALDKAFQFYEFHSKTLTS